MAIILPEGTVNAWQAAHVAGTVSAWIGVGKILMAQAKDEADPVLRADILDLMWVASHRAFDLLPSLDPIGA